MPFIFFGNLLKPRKNKKVEIWDSKDRFETTLFVLLDKFSVQTDTFWRKLFCLQMKTNKWPKIIFQYLKIFQCIGIPVKSDMHVNTCM
jgi:hypothetical protein